MPKHGILYLIPAPLGDEYSTGFLPEDTLSVIPHLEAFIVENLRTARRFLRKIGYTRDFDDVIFYELNRRTSPNEWATFLSPLLKGKDMGLLSEAGAPAVADPGSEIVALAHEKNIKVKPLTGPSSILLALMASGLNGQGFTFHGYLPRQQKERIKTLKKLEFLSKKTGQTQIFMETPYRNILMLEDIASYLSPYTRLCLAINLTQPDEKIITKTIESWQKSNVNLHKKPAIFLLQA